MEITDNLSSYYSSCTQCPRKCGINRVEGKTGVCGESADLRAAFAGLHFGEEPLITVHGGSGTIFLTGCTLRCAFCQNYQISQNGLGSPISAENFIAICEKLQKKGAENINLVTPSHHIPLLADFIKQAKDNKITIPFCWNSSAYESVEMLELLKGLVTIWLPDLKTLNSELSKTLFAAKDYPKVAKDAISWMIDNNPLKICEKSGFDRELGKQCSKEKLLSGVIIRHLFLPGRFEETAEVLGWLKENADGRAIISLMNQYTPVPFDEDSDRAQARKNAISSIDNRLVTTQEDADIQDLIEAYDFEYLFYQELSDDTSWLPDFRRTQPFSNKLAVPIKNFVTNTPES